MRGIGELCRRRQALGRFLNNRRSDIWSRLHLERFNRGELQDQVDEELSIASEGDIEVRLKQQDQKFLILKTRGLLTNQWIAYGERRSSVIFQSPTRAPNGQTSLPRQRV